MYLLLFDDWKAFELFIAIFSLKQVLQISFLLSKIDNNYSSSFIMVMSVKTFVFFNSLLTKSKIHAGFFLFVFEKWIFMTYYPLRVVCVLKYIFILKLPFISFWYCGIPVNTPELDRYWADAASIGPVLAHTGLLTGTTRVPSREYRLTELSTAN